MFAIYCQKSAHRPTTAAQAGDAVLCQQLGVESGVPMAQIAAATPAGYMGKPEDVASLVSYLASKEAHFITGQSVSFRWRDWLMHAWSKLTRPTDISWWWSTSRLKFCDARRGARNLGQT